MFYLWHFEFSTKMRLKPSTITSENDEKRRKIDLKVTETEKFLNLWSQIDFLSIFINFKKNLQIFTDQSCLNLKNKFALIFIHFTMMGTFIFFLGTKFQIQYHISKNFLFPCFQCSHLKRKNNVDFSKFLWFLT